MYSPHYWVRVSHRHFGIPNHHFHPRLGPHQIFYNLSHPPRIWVTMTTFQWFCKVFTIFFTQTLFVRHANLIGRLSWELNTSQLTREVQGSIPWTVKSETVSSTAWRFFKWEEREPRCLVTPLLGTPTILFSFNRVKNRRSLNHKAFFTTRSSSRTKSVHRGGGGIVPWSPPPPLNLAF